MFEKARVIIFCIYNDVARTGQSMMEMRCHYAHQIMFSKPVAMKIVDHGLDHYNVNFSFIT